MSTEQLKNLVIDKISGIEDGGFLKAIKKILDTQNISSSPYRTNAKQKEKIKKGLRQLEKKKIISNENLEKEEDEWLRK